MSYITIDDQNDFASFFKEKIKSKNNNVNNHYTQMQCNVDIKRMKKQLYFNNHLLEMFIDKAGPNCHLESLFNNIFDKIYSFLKPEKQTEYKTHLSRVLNQGFLNIFSLYLYHFKKFNVEREMAYFNPIYKVTLDEEAIYINISYVVLVFPSIEEYQQLENSRLKSLRFRKIKGETTFKIITQSCKDDCIKVDTSIIHSQLSYEKQYTDYFIKSNSIWSSIIELIKYFIAWIKGNKIQETVYLDPYSDRKDKFEALCKEDKIEIPPLDLSLSKEHLIETLYFDPHLNKYAENLNDFNQEEIKKDENSIPNKNQPINDRQNSLEKVIKIDRDRALKEKQTKKEANSKANQFFLFKHPIKLQSDHPQNRLKKM